jgi:DNA-binding NarL/FixJ family response regulator
MSSVRTVIVDDHTLVRAGLRRLIQDVDNIEVVGEARDANEALAIVESLRPDLVLMDIAMPPGINGLEATVRIKVRFPDTRVIVLSMHSSAEYVLQALRAGASGYLVKNAAPGEIGVAVEAVMNGSVYLSPAVSRWVVEGYLDRLRISSKPQGPLSPRQREVLHLIAEGCSSKEIARRLGISVKTVETHRTELMARLDIHDVARLVRYAIKAGLIQSDDR